MRCEIKKFKMYLIRASQQVGITGADGTNISQKKFQIKINPDNASYIQRFKV